MSNLENFIKNEHDSFDEETMPLGHEGRFLMKLEKRKHDNENRVRFWRVAASIIVLLVAGGSLLLPRFNSPADVQYGSIALSDVSSDMADIELYYTSQLEEKYAGLQELSETDLNVKSLFNELASLNDEYENLERELYRSGTNDKVILAMIENFRLRLKIVEQLEKIKQAQLS
ncbi:MAG: septal ring factor EnvC (AmiA/AmiB activator) [Flammeovirgaceae bacterium]|jgi:septal ring factor EnvC (AmiA/AmiB activator)